MENDQHLLLRSFKIIDTDDDGFVSRKEFQDAMVFGKHADQLHAAFGAAGASWKKLFGWLDSDRDGLITFDDFCRGVEHCSALQEMLDSDIDSVRRSYSNSDAIEVALPRSQLAQVVACDDGLTYVSSR